MRRSAPRAPARDCCENWPMKKTGNWHFLLCRPGRIFGLRSHRRPSMELSLTTVLVTFAGVFLICFMKGAFGGGFAIVGIPLLSIVMDPVTAGGLLAPLFIAM